MKNPHAVALGKPGGKGRVSKTTPEQRRRWARLGGLARASKYDHAALTRWGKLGGRPRKEGEHNAN
jgi:hypothetical protein